MKVPVSARKEMSAVDLGHPPIPLRDCVGMTGPVQATSGAREYGAALTEPPRYNAVHLIEGTGAFGVARQAAILAREFSKGL